MNFVELFSLLPTDLEGEQSGRCFGASIGFGYSFTGTERVEAKAKGESCGKTGSFEKGGT